LYCLSSESSALNNILDFCHASSLKQVEFSVVETKMTDPGCVQIKEWTVSFYKNDTRKWKYGVLKVTPEFFEFVENESDRHHPYTKIINHCDVIDVKKSSTSLIFRAIVIIVNDKTKYWISSLPDQGSMYNVLHYFQRQNLFSCKKLKTTTLESVCSTEMGRKLLNSVIDSENTLTNANLWLG
jgi:hypothetical protein